jgi:hypothetical protein
MQGELQIMRPIVFAILASTFALSPAAARAWSGYQTVTIALLTIYQSGHASPPGVVVTISPANLTDVEGCSHSSQGYAWVDYSSQGEPDGKALYATLLAAQIAGKSISLGLNGCASNGFPMIYAIEVSP